MHKKLIMLIGIMILSFKEINASCSSKLILEFSDSEQKIEARHCDFDGIEYIELKNITKGYNIICELNKKQQLFLIPFGKKGSYGDRYYAITDTTGGSFRSANGLVYKKEDKQGDLRILNASKKEMELMNAAIAKLKSPNALKYDLDLSSILFFLVSVPVIE